MNLPTFLAPLPLNLVRPPFWGSDLDQKAGPVNWLWHGYLAAGNVTLLTSQWKSGKTTLVSILLDRMRAGGKLAGQTLAPGRAAMLSEENPSQWRERKQGRLNFDHVLFYCQPFRGKPSGGQWQLFVNELAARAAEHEVKLLVIDTLATFLPGHENGAAAMLEALLPLQQLTSRGLAILLLHHPRKGEPLPGQAARGSGALSGFCDIIAEMGMAAGSDPDDRRRRLLAFSRHEQTPRQLVIELDAAGADYHVLGDFAADEFTHNWERLRMLLEDARGKKTRQEILADWPPDFPAPADGTLWRWLGRAVAAGLLCRQGTGRKSDPFRYWLPGQDKIWEKDPLYCLEEQSAAAQADLRKLLDGAR